VTVRKHLTRHDMKQDEVLSWLTRAIVWVEENSTKVLVGLGAALGVALIAMGAVSWSRSRTQESYRMLAEVQKVAATPLASEAGAGADSFATARERAQRTIDAADRMLGSFGSGAAADWARYHRAVALLDLGQAKEAAQAASELSASAGTDTLLGGLSRMIAGQAEEAQSNLQAAVDHYAAAAAYEGSGFPPELALIGQARCLDGLGRTQEAVDTYQKVLDLYPDSPLASRASRRLQEIRGS
jgi:tetratricopeptide (TPR) repeat protein